MTKGQNKTLQRRQLRKKNKNSDVQYDIMLGAAVKRNWGGGGVK